MKKIFKAGVMASVIAICCILSVGCTRNNGDIGVWFGTWKLESMSNKGNIGNSPAIIWKFQNHVIEMQEVWEGNHDSVDHFGSWTQVDDHLILDFGHSDNLFPAGSWKYTPPAVTEIPNGITEMVIKELSNKRIELIYNRPDSEPIVYKLIRWS